MWSIIGASQVAKGKESACQCRTCQRHRFHPWIGKILWSRKWQPTPVFLPGRFHEQRSPAGYSPLGQKSQTRLSNWALDCTVKHNIEGLFLYITCNENISLLPIYSHPFLEATGPVFSNTRSVKGNDLMLRWVQCCYFAANPYAGSICFTTYLEKNPNYQLWTEM